MAEYVYHIDGFSLATSWERQRSGLSTTTGIGTIDLVGSSVTKTIDLSDIILGEGENVKRAVLTATLNRVGTTDYMESITVNGLSFGTGTRKLDVSTIAPGSSFDIKFYFCASGAYPEVPPIGTSVYDCTLWVSDVTLTIVTGVGSAFDGMIGSLPEGSKILIDEPDGVQGTYSIVHHGYGDDTLCLLWRDNCVSSNIAFNYNYDTFLADNDGALDKFLNQTFYEALPDTTKIYIQPAIYPTLDKGLYGTVQELTRYVCTPSVRELTETGGGEEWHGLPLNYLETKNSGEVYWTRSVYQYASGSAWLINASGNSVNSDRGYARGVRPCFCVLENQMVVPSDDGTYYMLTSKVQAPFALYLNGDAADLYGQQRDIYVTLSWDAVISPIVTGYEVWSRDTADGAFAFLGSVSAIDGGSIPTELPVRSANRGFMETQYKVKAVTAPDTDFLDSELSDDERVLATRRTNVHYYDGTRWLLAMPNHYDGYSWTEVEGFKYYIDNKWEEH